MNNNKNKLNNKIILIFPNTHLLYKDNNLNPNALRI